MAAVDTSVHAGIGRGVRPGGIVVAFLCMPTSTLDDHYEQAIG